MITKHTPGPWSIIQDAPLNPKARFQIGSRKENGFATYVCTIKAEKGLILDRNQEANANLIACAPELLLSLEILLLVADHPNNPMREGANAEIISQARRAIAKAKGGN